LGTIATLKIRKRRAPYRDQPIDVLFVDLSEWAVALCGITHPINENVAGRLLVVLQILGGLGEHHRWNGRAQQESQQR
jgi:hypothetical protein